MKAISFAAPIPTYLATQVAGRISDKDGNLRVHFEHALKLVERRRDDDPPRP